VAQKALYLELAGTLDLEDGGALAVLTVIASYQFDRAFVGCKVRGAVIYPDYTYEFFDLVERSKTLREHTRQELFERARPVPATPIQLDQLREKYLAKTAAAGEIVATMTAWKRSEGFGFAMSNAGESYFIHVNSVIDDRLREDLNHVPYSENPYPVDIPLLFADGGYTRAGAKYKAARNIRRGIQRSAEAAAG
jgi:hypothetical protein